MLMAQKKFLRLCQEDVGKPLESHLVIHYLCNVKLAIELVEKTLVCFNPFVSLTKDFIIANFFS